MVPRLHRPEGDMSAPLSLSLFVTGSGQTQGLQRSRAPPPHPSLVTTQDRQAGRSFLPASSSHRHQGNTSGMLLPECSVHSNIGTSPSANPISSTPQNSPLPLLSLPDGEEGGLVANHRHSQCTHACLRQFSKVPVYLLSGRCPQNIMHHTYKSFTL